MCPAYFVSGPGRETRPFGVSEALPAPEPPAPRPASPLLCQAGRSSAVLGHQPLRVGRGQGTLLPTTSLNTDLCALKP